MLTAFEASYVTMFAPDGLPMVTWNVSDAFTASRWKGNGSRVSAGLENERATERKEDTVVTRTSLKFQTFES